ncbi:MAG: DUF362 domain-containing protein [Kiritimatiellia bacterium]|nr:DUF362 domain-containing protein [Lentisphaerota bacterium]
MKAAIVQCGGYQPETISSAVERLLALLDLPWTGLWGGRRILIKPNLLTDKPPECAATTHPEVVRALVRLVKHHGGLPLVADSAASPVKLAAVWERTGFAAMCAEEQVPLISLEQAGAEMFNFRGVPFSIARPVLEADFIINACKLKTHLLTVITNAVKNIYGVVPGAQKTALHKHFPDPGSLGAFLAHLYSLVRPGLTVTDAVLAMEGNGPSSGRPVSLGFLAASTDGVMLDAVVSRLLGIDPTILPFLVPPLTDDAGALAARGVLMGDVAAVQGACAGFVLPATLPRRLIPAGLVRLLQPLLWSKPEFTAACIRCGRCVAACPAPAIRLPDTGLPVLDSAACIECGCCSEVCPVAAIVIRSSRLARLAGSLCRPVRVLASFLRKGK